MNKEINELEFSEDFLDGFYRLYNEKFESNKQYLHQLNHTLETLIDSKVESMQKKRLRVEKGRIKKANRLLWKAKTKVYRPSINEPEDAFKNIYDIIGTRITCNTTSDVYAAVDILESMMESDDPDRSIVKIISNWIDDYIKEPKPSGYRGINCIIGIRVPIGSQLLPAACEVQIRTLLQDAWGELTHEDTYKPGVRVPELVERLSLRLATTLAVLDEISQDLREELDKVENKAEIQVSIEDQVGKDETPKEPSLDDQESVILSEEDISEAYEKVYDEKPNLAPPTFVKIINMLPFLRVNSKDAFKKLLETNRTKIDEISMKYERANFTDYGRILHSIEISKDEELGIQKAHETLEKVQEKRSEEARFIEKYPIGKEMLGTVVHVGREYALVQMPDGDTGILHYTSWANSVYEFITISDYVNLGDTIRVEILKVIPKDDRIELRLIDDKPKNNNENNN